MLGGVARAQEATLTAPPPVRLPIDAHGVDVVNGQYTFNLPLVSVGTPGAGGLEYHRTLIGGGWRDSYVGTINYTTVSGTAVYTVSIGGSSETFSLSGGVYTAQQASGSTLTQSGGVYTYTTGNGTVATFSVPSPGPAGPWAANGGVINTIRKVDGEVDTFNYGVVNSCGDGVPLVVTLGGAGAGAASTATPTAPVTGSTTQVTPTPNQAPGCDPNTNYSRLASITNNLGYELDLTYAQPNPNLPYAPQLYIPTTITSFNNADNSNVVGYERANFPAPDNTQPSRTVTDALGRVKTFNYDAGGRILSYIPGTGASASATLTYDSSGRVHTFADGMYTYTYSYSDDGTSFTTTVAGPTGNKVYVSNDSKGVVTSVTDVLGHKTSYAYGTN